MAVMEYAVETTMNYSPQPAAQDLEVRCQTCDLDPCACWTEARLAAEMEEFFE